MFDKLKKARNVSGIKIIDQSDIDEVINQARKSEKRRLPVLLNKSFSEIPQRFVNCLTKSTYVRPHNHVVTGHWELMSWLAGEIYVLFFDEEGNITNKFKMSHDGVKVVEISPNIYHTFVTENYGAYLEIRNCSFEPEFDRAYATWAPPEGSEGTKPFLENLINKLNLK
jgi:cupin fold WbuC family metalloprotein